MALVVVPWACELVPADLLEVWGTAPDLQVRLVLRSDPEFPDADRPVQVSLHVSELAPCLAERILALESA